MTGNQFLRLCKGDQVEADDPNDDKIYEVQGTDSMGRIEMQELSFVFDYKGIDYRFGSFDEAFEELEGIQSEDANTTLCELDIKEERVGEPFWMHYKDVLIHY